MVYKYTRDHTKIIPAACAQLSTVKMLGASIKSVTGGGVRGLRCMTVCDRGGAYGENINIKIRQRKRDAFYGRPGPLGLLICRQFCLDLLNFDLLYFDL